MLKKAMSRINFGDFSSSSGLQPENTLINGDHREDEPTQKKPEGHDISVISGIMIESEGHSDEYCRMHDVIGHDIEVMTESAVLEFSRAISPSTPSTMMQNTNRRAPERCAQ